MTCHCSWNFLLPWQPYFDRHVFPNLECSCFFKEENNFLAMTFTFVHHFSNILLVLFTFKLINIENESLNSLHTSNIYCSFQHLFVLLLYSTRMVYLRPNWLTINHLAGHRAHYPAALVYTTEARFKRRAIVVSIN